MIKLSKPYIPEGTYEKVIDVLKSGLLVQGKYVEQFESELKEYLGIEHVVLVSSGTAALHLALIALGIEEGDEVIVPAFTFPATANVVEMVGAKPVLVDISLKDFCINVDLIEEAITPKTKAIIPVHEFGQSADIESIMKIAEKHNLFVIEDAACALGTEFDNKKCGTFGNIGCFSLHPRKAITTGEGGIIVTNDLQIAQKLKSYRNHGIQYNDKGMDFVYAGFNYRLTEIQAVIGIEQLKIIDELIERRIKTAKLYDNLLSGISWINTPKLFKERKMVYQTYHLLLDENIDRDHLIKDLKNNGVETNYGAQALNCLTFFKHKYNYNDKDFPFAFRSFKKGLALPLGTHINESIVGQISDLLKKV